jgi:excisionase family DNA binding protein
MNSTLTVRDLCERYGVTEHTVLAWIRSGEMLAVHVGRKAGAKKPRWRITQAALDAFEQLRTPSTPRLASHRKKRTTGDVVEFYK